MGPGRGRVDRAAAGGRGAVAALPGTGSGGEHSRDARRAVPGAALRHRRVVAGVHDRATGGVLGGSVHRAECHAGGLLRGGGAGGVPVRGSSVEGTVMMMANVTKDVMARWWFVVRVERRAASVDSTAQWPPCVWLRLGFRGHRTVFVGGDLARAVYWPAVSSSAARLKNSRTASRFW